MKLITMLKHVKMFNMLEILKIMKTFILILITFMLSGCLWQTIDINDIKRATEICAKMNSTVFSISVKADATVSTICSDYKKYSLGSDKY